MTARARHPLGIPHRLGPAVFAFLLAATFAAAPLTHPETCTGACAGSAAAGAAHGGEASVPACHGSQGDGQAEPRGCTCTDDCCSLLAQFVAAPSAADEAAPALLVRRTLPAPPDDAHRAPSARLLPYPTGPPATL